MACVRQPPLQPCVPVLLLQVLKVYHRKHKLEVGDRSTQENLKLRQALMQDLEDSDKAKLQASRWPFISFSGSCCSGSRSDLHNPFRKPGRSPIGLQIKALYVYLARNKQPVTPVTHPKRPNTQPHMHP